MRIAVGTDRGLHHLDGTIDLIDARVDHISDGWAVGDGALYARTPQGWAEVDIPDPGHVTCVAGTASGVLAGLAGAHLLEGDTEGMDRVASFDRADTRSMWHTPWGGPPDVRSIAIAPDGRPFVNVHVGGILRGGDHGWQATIDLNTDVHHVIAVNQLILAALGAGGLAVSDDQGATWHHRRNGLHATYCRAVAVAGDTVLLSASDGPRGNRAALYRTPLRGNARFERCTNGLPEWFDDNIDTHALAAQGNDVAFGTRHGAVYHSGDAGRTWHEVTDRLPPVRCIDLIIEP
jgi:hypothetical protein